MEKEFVNYNQALKLKALGFDEDCFACYTKDGELSYDFSDNRGEGHYFQECSAPTYSQAFRWFREKYGLFIGPAAISYEDGPYLWFFEINSTTLPFGTDLGVTDDFETYEEAELACLDKLIEIVESKPTQNSTDARTMEKLIESNRKFDEKNNTNVKYNSSDRNEDTPNITNFFI